MRKPRHAGHKISLALSFFCALLTLPAAGVFVYFWQSRGLADTWTPSMLAITAFFACCAAVLYAMSVAQPVLPAAEDTADQ